MIRIKNWFEGNRNFQKGKLLYDQFGHDDELKALFQLGKSAKSQIILERELQHILEHKSLDKVIEHSDAIKKAPSAKPPKETPEELKKPIAQKNDLYMFVRNMHARMCYSDSKEERRELAWQILDTWNAINNLWSKIDHFYEHGKLPEAPKLNTEITIKADTNDLIDMYERYKTLGSYISRNKKKGDKVREQLARDESNMIVDIINKLYGHQKLKPR